MDSGASATVAIGTLLSRRKERGSDDDPLLSLTQDKGVIPQDEAGRRNISSANKTTYWRVYPGDIVYNTMRMWQGASARSDYFGIVSPAYTVCCPAPESSARFLSYSLKLPGHIRIFRARSQGLTSDVWNLHFAEFARIRLKFVPGYIEQERIAAILSSVDEAIEKTQAVIGQVQVVKRGMLQELLTKGLPGRHERFKKTDIGEIPAEWQTASLMDVGSWFSGGTPNRQNGSYWNGSIPWISGKDMKHSRLEDAIEHVSTAAIGHGTRLVPIGSILVVVRGMILAHTFPVSLTTRQVAFNQDLKALVPNESFDPEFVLYWLQYRQNKILDLVETASHGTKRLPTPQLFAQVIPLPQREEQKRIAQFLRINDAYSSVASASLEHLAILKSALMSVLLTGELRVTPDPEPA